MKLNLGCGPKALDGWTNCDLYSEAADVVCDIRRLPFLDGSADEVQIYHTIEHVPRADGVKALVEIARVLRPDGTVAIETPDRLKCIALIRGAGPKSPALNQVEGTRAATGFFYPESSRLLNGVKGALGGVSGTRAQKRDWHRWLLSRAGEIRRALEAGDITQVEVPVSCLPGEPHLYLWHAAELAAELDRLGFDARVDDPQSHGQRTWRDCRVVGIKR